MPSSSSKGSSTQNFLSIADVKDDVIIGRDGGLRAVLAVSSTNFVLKSQDEQNAILARYQNFLNALNFPIQILMQSRRLDIHGYMEQLRERASQQNNELLRVQTEEYVEYINKLLEFGNIMNKTFFIVIPFTTENPLKQGLFQKIKNIINPTQKIVENNQKLAEGLEILNDRTGRVESGLESSGLRTMRLNTTELVELLYRSYNVGTAQVGWVDVKSLNLS